MKQIITIQFQSAPKDQRPTDAALNREVIETDNMGNIPSVDDYVCFDNENEKEVVYKIKSRLFDYKYEEKIDNWSIFANIVVERQPKSAYEKLIKH